MKKRIGKRSEAIWSQSIGPEPETKISVVFNVARGSD